MADLSDAHAMALERSCAVSAVALSDHRREGVRLVTGAKRTFGLDASLTHVHVPYPVLTGGGARRAVTCGVALQCSPSKELISECRLNELSTRELCALVLVESGVALGWITARWPGLLPELRRALPALEIASADMDVHEMLNRAIEMARTDRFL